MNRPPAKDVELAMTGKVAGHEAISTLCAEVRALREDYADIEARSLEALEQMTRDAVTAITDVGIDANLAERCVELEVEMAGWKEEAGDAEELRATIARVEALPSRWRSESDRLCRRQQPTGEQYVSEGGLTYDCKCRACLLEAALKGEP